MASDQLPAVTTPGTLTTQTDTYIVPALIADAGRSGRVALRRILHRQHPQSEYAPRLCPGMHNFLRLVRRARPDADDDPATRCRHLYRDTRADPFGAGREAAAGSRADAVRLADHRPDRAG